MIRGAIVEDDPVESRILLEYLERYSKEKEVPAAWYVYANGEQFLADSGREIDIIFMDVELGGINGIETSRRMREYDRETLLILITNLMQYAVQGYSVKASDYIVKPIRYEEFEKRMDEYVCSLENKNSQITMKSGRDIRKYNISSIMYLEVYGHQLYVHTKERKDRVCGTLSQMEDVLSPYGFVKCNKCYLVNLEHVDGIAGDDVEVAGAKLKISRREKTDFIHALTGFTKG